MFPQVPLLFIAISLGSTTIKCDNEGKNNVLSANKQSNKLHTAVSEAFSYLLQCRVKTGGKMFLFIVFLTDSTEGGGAEG